MLYKDACNGKSNQQHLGTIKCSNLCTEIIEYTSEDEVAVCNLASVVLPKFVSKRTAVGSDATATAVLPSHCGVYHVTDETATAIQPPLSSLQQPQQQPQQQHQQQQGGYVFDHFRLYEATKVITRNLNKIIDSNYYPIQEARNSNMRHRPIGIGVQGLFTYLTLLFLTLISF